MCVCLGCEGVLNLCELKGILHTHKPTYTKEYTILPTLLYLLNYYNFPFAQESCALRGHCKLIATSVLAPVS